MNSSDSYGRNIFVHDSHRDGPGAWHPRSQAVHVGVGMVLEDVVSGWVGAVTRVEKSGGVHLVEFEDRRGACRSFPLDPSFWFEGCPIEMLPPHPALIQAPSETQVSASGRRITNSGSFAPASSGLRIAKCSRIWVEEHHNTELVQHAWGKNLAEAGTAVWLLEGVDDPEAILEVFGPTDAVHVGVLIGHMVPGSKGPRTAEVVSVRQPGVVFVLDHPSVNIWQAIKPAHVGLEYQPDILRSTDIKHETLEALGWPHADQCDVTMGQKWILSTVRTCRDLKPALLGRAKELTDFVIVPWAR